MRLLILLFLPLSISLGVANNTDEPFKSYLAGADLVVTGKITSDPSCLIGEASLLNSICEFRVSGTLNGDTELEGQIIHGYFERFEMDITNKHRLIKKDGECIRFLKEPALGPPSWATADYWFGMQEMSPWMTYSLKRLTTDN
jgi:hypothetical protein